MSTIRVIYEKEPNFPALAQHPNAVRYFIGALVVDAIGGQPTQAEIDAVLNPVRQPLEPDAGAVLRALVKKGIITVADARAEINV